MVVAAANKVCKKLGVSVSDTSPGALEKTQENYKLIGIAEKHEVIQKYTRISPKGLEPKRGFNK